MVKVDRTERRDVKGRWVVVVVLEGRDERAAGEGRRGCFAAGAVQC